MSAIGDREIIKTLDNLAAEIERQPDAALRNLLQDAYFAIDVLAGGRANVTDTHAQRPDEGEAHRD